MTQDDRDNTFETETGTLKFGSGDLVIINEQDCRSVPALGIYDSLGAYLGETVEEAKQTLEKREVEDSQNEK